MQIKSGKLTTVLLDGHQELAFAFENRIDHDILGLEGVFKFKHQVTIKYMSSISERQNSNSMVKHDVVQLKV